MGAHCKGKCKDAYKRVGHGKDRYQEGYKFCRLCIFYTKTNDIRCVCCTRPFRVRARNRCVGSPVMAKSVARI